MTSIEQRIWDWLPARRDRRRVTNPNVTAVALGLPTAPVAVALAEMEARGHVIRDKYGSYHRSTPLPTVTTNPDWEQETLC